MITEVKVYIVEDNFVRKKEYQDGFASLEIKNLIFFSNTKALLNDITSAQNQHADLIIAPLNDAELDGLALMRMVNEILHEVAFVLLSDSDENCNHWIPALANYQHINLLACMEYPLNVAKLKAVRSRLLYLKQHIALEHDTAYVKDKVILGLDNNQFSAIFRPVFNLKSGRIESLSAIPVWQHPKEGMVVLEERRHEVLTRQALFGKLSILVLKQAASACKNLLSNKILINLSVGICLESLSSPSYSNEINAIIQTEGLSPSQFIFEIKQAQLDNLTPLALEALNRFCMQGYTVALSSDRNELASASYLNHLPITQWNISSSILSYSLESKQARAYLASYIEMAKKQNIKVIAQGVKDNAIVELIKILGFDATSGQHISNDMQADNLTTYIQSYKHKTFETDDLTDKAILVIDDNEFVRNMVGNMITNLGYKNVTKVNGAQSALLKMSVSKYDLLLTDIEMPETNGLELVKMIRSGKSQLNPNTRIIMITGNTQQEVLGVALALDVNGFIVKPFKSAVLNERITNALTEEFEPNNPLSYQSISTLINKTNSEIQKKDSDIQDEASSDQPIHVKDKEDQSKTQKKGKAIPVEQLLAGMQLAENITLKNEKILLTQGYRLTQGNVSRLQELKTFLSSHFVYIV